MLLRPQVVTELLEEYGDEEDAIEKAKSGQQFWWRVQRSRLFFEHAPFKLHTLMFAFVQTCADGPLLLFIYQKLSTYRLA